MLGLIRICASGIRFAKPMAAAIFKARRKDDYTKNFRKRDSVKSHQSQRRRLDVHQNFRRLQIRRIFLLARPHLFIVCPRKTVIEKSPFFVLKNRGG